MTELLGLNYGEQLCLVESWNGNKIIDDKGRVYSSVIRCFELRHIYCHEVTTKISISKSEAKQLVTDCELFLEAADKLHLNALYPGPGLSQSEMNMKAGADLYQIEKEIFAIIDDIKSYLTKQRFKEFMALHKKWEAYRKTYSTYRADSYKGGSVWPTVYCEHATYLTKKRLEELMQYLIEVQEFEDAR